MIKNLKLIPNKLYSKKLKIFPKYKIIYIYIILTLILKTLQSPIIVVFPIKNNVLQIKNPKIKCNKTLIIIIAL